MKFAANSCHSHKSLLQLGKVNQEKNAKFDELQQICEEKEAGFQ